MQRKDITIVIADDHPLLLKGLNEELTNHKYNVVGVAADGMQALELILLKKPTIALLDIDMPMLSGFEVIKTAKEKEVSTKFIVLSFHKENSYLLQAKSLELNGYLLKEDSFFEIERCMDAVIRGETYFSPSFEVTVLDGVRNEQRKLGLLTPSEVVILKQIARQTSTNEIAEKLNVSVRTVEKHRSNIIVKLDLEGSTNTLTKWALSNKNSILEL
ncbi:response regulator [Ulvibacterium sp.]|uniref:response regulator n=1 Tax=Ulvibacterium sp. TaxID=2665914 RepID=UPI003BAA9438